MFRTGYILNRSGDVIWFLAFPFFAVGVALLCQQWLSAVVIGSIALWITIPHHFATWLRTYGLREDRQRFRERIIVGPLVICGMTLVGLRWAPLTFFLLVKFWDHQHSVMQQYGFARIYDYKAGTGAPATGRLDLLLNWTLYVNLILTSPLYTPFVVRVLYHFHVPLSASGVRALHFVSWTFTATFVCAYLGHLGWCLARGYPVNPIKLLFIGASYFLWYFVAWQTTSLLLHAVAHRMMHGVQYIVIVHSYLRRKLQSNADHREFLTWLVQLRNVWAFLIMGLFYAMIYQLITMQPLDNFGFGVVNFSAIYEAIPALGIEGMSSEDGYDVIAAMLIESAALVHYYFDSFIWKVRDDRVQEGL